MEPNGRGFQKGKKIVEKLKTTDDLTKQMPDAITI